MSLCLVSGFIDRSRYDLTPPLHPVEFYLQHGKAFLALPHRKVVFLEPHVAELLQPELTASPQCTVVPYAKEEMEFWTLRTQFLACPLPPGANPAKDTHDYFLIMLNKIQWCLRAAALVPAAAYIWMDFGINYILKETTLAEAAAGLSGARLQPGHMRLPGCAPVYAPPHPAQLVWLFCGGLFGGDREALERFAAGQADVVQHLLQQGVATWEVTVWYHLCVGGGSAFMDWYHSDHNATMLTRF